MAVQITGALLMKRRPTGGAAGAPTTLRSGEPAFNEADNTLYIGVGDNGEGLATSVIAIGGSGIFVTKQFLENALENTGAGDMLKERYDANDDGVVDKADLANRVPWSGIQSRPDAFPPSAHNHDVATDTTPGFMSAEDKLKLTNLPANANNYVHPTGDGNRHVPSTSAANTGKFLKSGTSAGAASSWESLSKSDVGLGNVSNLSPDDMPISTAQQEAIDAKAALNSPAFTGAPTAPTAASNVSNKQIATTEFVVNRIQEIIGAAPEALDTLIELAEAIGNDPDFAGTITTMVAGKLAKTANLSDLASASVARENLGLGSLATQDANAVNLTGGTISNVVIEGGTF